MLFFVLSVCFIIRLIFAPCPFLFRHLLFSYKKSVIIVSHFLCAVNGNACFFLPAPKDGF